jgi:6-phosphogluconolactonase (cycloisomerase 2 family)
MSGVRQAQRKRMKLSLMGRITLATLASLALGLGMSACGGGTIGFMWVLGQQYNQITGFKVDDFSGNLTQIIGSPFSTNGTMPVSIVVQPGGRYVYVINQGTGGGPTTADSSGNPVLHKETSGGISLYSVGGDGVLTFQQTYQTTGSVPMWAVMDTGGSNLYVVNKYTPDLSVNTSNQPVGAITAFSIDSSTGRLILLTNQVQKDKNNNPLTYFNVGTGPFMMRASGGCLFTLDSDNSIFPYAFGTAGQITITTPGFLPIGAQNLTSINVSGSNVYLTDSASAAAPTNNRILPFTVGSQCSLTSLAGGAQNNQAGTSNPTYSMVDNGGKFLYVLNQSTTDTTVTTPFSTISAFNLNPTNGQLTNISGSPYQVGSNPVCMVEDTSNQYLYVSNRNDGTVTGFVLDQTRGELSSLTRGSTFPASGLGSCMAISGNVN